MKSINVAVGVIYNKQGEILISYRDSKQHQGDKWEFPGGKIESDESPQEALSREVAEELGVVVSKSVPLIEISHDYGDKLVTLFVFSVLDFDGVPHGKEGQPIKWVTTSELDPAVFPAANKPIIQAVCLPEVMVISSGDVVSLQDSDLLQIRQHDLEKHEYLSLARKVLCNEYQSGYVVFNTDVENWHGIASTLEQSKRANIGLHLTAWRARQLTTRPTLRSVLFGVSCHNKDELMHAESIGADYVLLSPVQDTPSHPEQAGMGWEKFKELTKMINVPVYALGGMRREDVEIAKLNGAQGVAGISLGK